MIAVRAGRRVDVRNYLIERERETISVMSCIIGVGMMSWLVKADSLCRMVTQGWRQGVDGGAPG